MKEGREGGRMDGWMKGAASLPLFLFPICTCEGRVLVMLLVIQKGTWNKGMNGPLTCTGGGGMGGGTGGGGVRTGGGGGGWVNRQV